MWTAIQGFITNIIGTTSLGELDFLGRVLYLVREYGPSYVQGAWNTLLVALIGTFLGCIIGLAVGIVQTVPVSARDSLARRGFLKTIRALLLCYVELFRGTPMMIQAVFIFYGIPIVTEAISGTPVFWDLWPSVILVVSINTGAYMAETVRGGILSIDPGQSEGAKAIGMTHVQTMLHVILPQTMRNIMPQIGNNLIINIKDSCVLFIIGFSELFSKHTVIAGARYRFFESALITMVIYLTMTVLLSRLLRLVEKKMEGSDSFDLATTDTLAHTTGMYSYPKRGSNFDERSIEYREGEPLSLEKDTEQGGESDE